MADILRVMVSSTIIDFKEHRESVRDAILKVGMQPDMTEDWASQDNDPIYISIDRVRKADIYLGILANRYGFVPPGYEISVTEMEYNEAVKRRLPRLMFLVDDQHNPDTLPKPDQKNQNKLKALKDRIATEEVIFTRFTSADDLRSKVIYALEEHSKYQNLGHADPYFVDEVDWTRIQSLDDLHPLIQRYKALIERERYDEVFYLFHTQLNRALLLRLLDSEQQVELIEQLFLDGWNQLPRLNHPIKQALVLNALSRCYLFSGQPQQAMNLCRRQLKLLEQTGSQRSLLIALRDVPEALAHMGKLKEATYWARRIIDHSRQNQDPPHEALGLVWLGILSGACGFPTAAHDALVRAINIFRYVRQNPIQSVVFSGLFSEYIALDPEIQTIIREELKILDPRADTDWEGMCYSSRSLVALWEDKVEDAYKFAQRAVSLTHKVQPIRLFAHRVLAVARLRAKDGARDEAERDLRVVLSDAAFSSYVQERLACMVGLAEAWLQEREPRYKDIIELLQSTLKIAEQQCYQLVQADIYNLLAEIKIAKNEPDDARDYAFKAYRLSWCDGPPYAYQRGLNVAQSHLKMLRQQPPSDLESPHEPVNETELLAYLSLSGNVGERIVGLLPTLAFNTLTGMTSALFGFVTSPSTYLPTNVTSLGQEIMSELSRAIGQSRRDL